MNPTADLVAMYKAIEVDPSDLTAYGAIADLLQELGYESLPHAYRWCQRRGKWLHRRTHYARATGPWYSIVQGRRCPLKFRWAWYVESPVPTSSRLAELVPAPGWPKSLLKYHDLPSLLIPGDQKVYPTHGAAMGDLAKWLEKLRECYELDEPKEKGL